MNIVTWPIERLNFCGLIFFLEYDVAFVLELYPFTPICVFVSQKKKKLLHWLYVHLILYFLTFHENENSRVRPFGVCIL